MKMKLNHQEAQLIQENLFNRALSIVTAKRRDYSGDEDPLANFRLSTLVGVTPVQGAMVRTFDKFSRIRTLLEQGTIRGEVKNENLEDTLADILNYTALIACLIAEEFPEFKAILLASGNQP